MSSSCALTSTMKPAARTVTSQVGFACRKQYGSVEARSARRDELRAKLAAQRSQPEPQRLTQVAAPALSVVPPEPIARSTEKRRDEEKVPALPTQLESLRTACEKQPEKATTQSPTVHLAGEPSRVIALGNAALSRCPEYAQNTTVLAGCSVGIGVALGLFAPEVAAAGVAVKLACSVGAACVAGLIAEAVRNCAVLRAAVVRGSEAAPSGLVASGIASLACVALGLSGPAAWPVILGGAALGMLDGDSLVQGGMGYLEAAKTVGVKAAALAGVACLVAGASGFFMAGAA